MVNIACHEFKAEFAYTSGDVLVGFLCLPFGFSGSPGLFQVATDAIKAVHRRTGPSTPERDGDHAFDCHIFVDDGIFVEPRLGKRQIMVAEKWEATVKSLLGDDAINEEKKATEGSWSCQNCILGFEVNTETMKISLPQEKNQCGKRFCARQWAGTVQLQSECERGAKAARTGAILEKHKFVLEDDHSSH